MKRLSFSLVASQFLLLAMLVLSGPGLPHTGAGWLLWGTAGALMLWAIVSVKLHSLSVFPEPVQGGKLCQKGPYRLIRHPMYLALLLLCASYCTDQFNFWRILASVLLLIVLLAKIALEEDLLHGIYPGYEAYSKRTWRLIPYVW